MDKPHKILILDDDHDWLALSQDLLASLPSHPEILTASSGHRALALLKAEPVRVLVCDLKMPRMDGLQVLAIVHRQHPEVRTIILSGLEDEDYRSRAYALGADMFWIKGEMLKNSQLFMDCVESFMGSNGDPGFRSVQSKSLADLVQMECLLRSSATLTVSRGPQMGKIWIRDGVLIDAETETEHGETAFRQLCAWKFGTFEKGPLEPGREPRITRSVDELLAAPASTQPDIKLIATPDKLAKRISLLAREGANFALAIPANSQADPVAVGTQNGPMLSLWAKNAAAAAARLGEQLVAGSLQQINAHTQEAQTLTLMPSGRNRLFLLGWPAETEDNLLEKSRNLIAAWDY